MSITIALSKGRILEETLPLLEKAGIHIDEDLDTTRKLIIESGDIRFFLIRSADVCTYVERGAADMGIVGRDLLLEFQPNLMEPLDLRIGKCRMCVAAPKERASETIEVGSKLKIATKYDNIARNYYLSKGIQVDIIHLYGSMELAPLVGMADRIVDLVSTGNTMKANNLVETDTLFDISSRLVVNPASFATKRDVLAPMIQHLRKAVEISHEAA